LLFGANTPWNRVRFTRGFGTNAASLAMKSSGSKYTWVVPSREPFRVVPYYPGYPELPQVRALPGSRTYGDRNYVVDYLSPNLAGGIALQTANDDKYATSSFWPQILTFSAPAYVYVVWDSRIPTLPAWLNGWELTGETYKSEALIDPRVYRQQVFANETLSFGPNLAPPAAPADMAFVSNYVVIAKPL
jgi:hypothetical protein